jgi:GntR family transcriptional regulator/MocR family aminotransferase
MTFHVSLVGRTHLSVEIYRQVRDAILRGVLHPGDRLPATRELARTLSVSRMTVTIAYERLTSEGFTISRVGDGTFVSDEAAPQRRQEKDSEVDGPLRARAIWQSIALSTTFAQPARFDFRTGVPDVTLFPRTIWRRLMARTLRADAFVSATSTYGDPAGDPQLRAAIATHIGIARGVVVSADDITITNGTQQAIDILARVLLSPGDRVAFEDPGYTMPRRAFQTLGGRVIGVPVDRDGLIVKALPRHAHIVYISPSHQFPLGVSMSLPRRQALLAWADRHDAAIIEDDYDSEFRFGGRPLEPLRTIDTAGRVIYVGSFSKTLLPDLRLGFIVAPRSLREAIRKAKFVADWHSPTLAQRALAEFIDEGAFGRHLRRVHAVYEQRHKLVTETIARDFAGQLDLVPSTTGLHVAAFARKASVERITAIARKAAAEGVAVQTLSQFAVGDSKHAGLMLGYGAIATDQIEEGLRRLRQAFRS